MQTGMVGTTSHPGLIVLDESPAGYSSASCSPALLASASPASTILVINQPIRLVKCSEWQLSPFKRVSWLGFTAPYFRKSGGTRTVPVVSQRFSMLVSKCSSVNDLRRMSNETI